MRNLEYYRTSLLPSPWEHGLRHAFGHVCRNARERVALCAGRGVGLAALWLCLVCITACGVFESEGIATDDTTIIITGFTFVPGDITAAPGDTVTFLNWDDYPHRILSQSANDLFDDTGALDSDIIPPGDARTVTVPDNSIRGDIIAFYDDVFRDDMITPNGAVVVE